MSTVHKVEPGECLSSIAMAYGFTDWRKIWMDPQNAGLRQQRKNPSVLLPGDQVFIPDRGQRELRLATSRVHKFKLKAQPCMLRIYLKDEDGKPFGRKRYRLTIDGHQHPDGRTGEDGLMEQRIAADAREGSLTVWMDESGDEGPRLRWDLALGHLDPIEGVSKPEAISGARARLSNLGYGAEAEGPWSERDRMALAAFQRKMKLEPTGELDEETTSALMKEHGV